MDVDAKLLDSFKDFDKFLNSSKKQFMKKWTEPLVPNAKLSDFKRVKTIGIGSYGRVMVVQHKQNSKTYAMKVIEKRHVVRTNQVRHTHNEIRVLAAIRFEFVINLDFYFKDNVYLYLVLPYIIGGEMFTHLKNMKKFDEHLSKFYAAQVILAIEYLHYLGLIYRDLKPENILIDRAGYVKVADYGFCKKVDDERTYTLCGTPEYLAPETILGKGYGYSVDWWALGVLIYEMNAGYSPFAAIDQMKTYEKIVKGKYAAPYHFSNPLKDLINCLLQVERNKRFGTLVNGAKDIKMHEWFKQIDYELLLLKRIKPPFVPIVSGADDVSNYDTQDEEDLRVSAKEEYPEEFKHITTS